MSGSTTFHVPDPITAVGAHTGNGFRVLSFDGLTLDDAALAELFVLLGIAQRHAYDSGVADNRGGLDVNFSEMFDATGGTGIGGFYAILFSALDFTIEQVILCHKIIQRRLFSSTCWLERNQEECARQCEEALDNIQTRFSVDLESSFMCNSSTRCIIFLLNEIAPTFPRALRTYRVRSTPDLPCTIRQALRATLADSYHLPPTIIQDEKFTNASAVLANPSRELIKELATNFPRGSQLACLVSLGADWKSHVHNPDSVAQDLLSLFRDTHCFFRLNVMVPAQDDSMVKSSALAYIQQADVMPLLDAVVEAIATRKEVVDLVRLGNIAACDARAPHLAHLEDILRNVKHLVNTQEQASILRMKDWLRPITHTGKLFANNRSKGQGTCEWFLGHPPTAKWLRTGGVFWFYGEMGTGKTFIMSHLIQNRLDNSNIVAYYYFEVTNHSTLSEDALFRSLIFQLSALNPSCIQRLIKTHENGSLTPQLPVLQGVLLELIQSAESPFYIVIDALDELLLPSERDSLWNFLLQLCDLRPAHMSLIFSTRNQEDIKATFEEVVQYAAHIVDTNVREDIAIFTKQVFSMARWTEWPETDIKMAQEVLNKNAAGQFLMAACQLEVLSTADTTRELKKLLIAMPRKLAETYQFILDRIILSPKRHRAKMLLAILVSAFESIPLEEMVSLLAVDTRTKGSIPTYDERNKAHNPQTIIALGNAFVVVTVKEQPSDRTPRPALQLAHASMRDFLLSQRSRKHWFYMDRDLAHSTTAKACLAVLVRNMTAAPLADQYARKWWFRHIFSPCESTLLDQQIALFNEFPLWPAEVIEGFLTTLENAVWPPRRPAIIRSAISAVSAANLYDLLEYMLSSSQKPDTLNHALCIAIEAGAMSKVIKLLISQGANVNVNAESRWSLRRLTQTSAKKESKDWDNYTETPLELAASKHDLALVKVLIKQGADINRSQALRGAAFVGAVDVVNLLVDKGAKVDKDGEDQGTALQTAASQGDLVMVRLLIGKGARVNGQGGYFGAALHAAAYAGAVDILEFLLEKGANVNLVAGHYGTALQAGVCAGRAAEQVVKLLVSNGADVNKEGGHYATALQAAVTLDKTDIITLLVEHGALLLGHSEPKS